MSSSTQFSQAGVMEVDSSSYHQGEYIRGTRFYDPVSEVDADLRQVFDESKPSRSGGVEPMDLREGCIVDIHYRKATNSVNTPYRVETIKFGMETRKKNFSATERKFVILLEPIIQNASVVAVKGFVREYDKGSTTVAYTSVFFKRPWDSPSVENIRPSWHTSQFNDSGFEEKDRSPMKFGMVFDEILAPLAGFETEIFSLCV